MVTVRDARPEEYRRIGEVGAAAFADDPIWTWVIGRDAPRDFARFMAVECALAARKGRVLVDDDLRAYAIWSPPGAWRSSPIQALRLAPVAIPLIRGRLLSGLRLMGTVEKAHPKQPQHWYLNMLATHPDHQGQGLASALVGEITRRCDEDGLPAYLESSKVENVPRYRRMGFEEGGELISIDDSPTLIPMWREPRPPEPSESSTPELG